MPARKMRRLWCDQPTGRELARMAFCMLLALGCSLGIAYAQSASQYDSLIRQGKTQLQAGHPGQALATGEQAIKLDPKDWEGYALAGGALMNLKRYDEAITQFSDAMQWAPQDKQAGLSELRKQCFAAESGSPLPPSAPPTPATEASTLEATTTQAEIVLWKSIENSTNPGDFQSYLGQYPHGAFSALAERHLDELRWKSVEGSTNPADLQSYLAQFPQGGFAAAAASRLKRLKAVAAVGATFQTQLAWLTQAVAADSRAQFHVFYRPSKGGWSSKPDLNKPWGQMVTQLQAIDGFRDCTLTVNEREELPKTGYDYPFQTDLSSYISLEQIDPSQIRALDVTDQRDVNGYGGANGWLVLLPGVSGTKPVTITWQKRDGKDLSQSHSGSGSSAAYLLVVNDPTAAPQAADLLRQMARACQSAESATADGSVDQGVARAGAQPSATPAQPQQF